MEPPNKTMKTSQLIISSNGSCFLCSKQVARSTTLHEEEPKPKLISHSIQKLSEFLELDIASVLDNGKAPIPPWLLDQMKKARLEVELCGKCIALNRLFLIHVGQPESKEVKLKSCLTLIQWRLSDARKIDATDQEDVKVFDACFISSTGSKFKMKLGILMILRWEVFQKCSRKVSTGSPRVQFHKLSRKDVTTITLKLKSNTPPHVVDSMPTENECNALQEEDVSDTAKDLDNGLPNAGKGDKDEPSHDNADYLPTNGGLRRSTRQRKSKRVSFSPEKHEVSNNANGKDPGRSSNLNTSVNYSNPIVVHGPTSKFTKRAKKSFKKWIFSPETRKYKCILCPTAGSSSHISAHFNSVHLNIRYKCPDANCGKLFAYQKNYHRHVDADHEKIRIECPFCKENVTRDTLYVHKKMYGERGICRSRKLKNEPTQTFSDGDIEGQVDNDRHLSNDQNSDANHNDNTPNHFSEGNEGKNQAQVSIAIPSVSPKESKDRSLANKTRNKRAKITKNGHPKQILSRTTSILNKSGKYAKPIIIVDGSESKSLKLTTKSFKKYIFTPETGKYKCNMCPKESRKAALIMRHFQSIHLTTIRFKCPDAECGKTFCDRKGYSRHALFSHLKIRYECRFCKQKVHRDTLYKHRKRHAERGVCSIRRLKKDCVENRPDDANGEPPDDVKGEPADDVKGEPANEKNDFLPDKDEDEDQADNTSSTEDHLSDFVNEDENGPQPPIPIPSTLEEKSKNVSSAKQTKSRSQYQRVKINRKGKQSRTGGASNLNTNGKYSKPIITYVSKSKSVDHANTSFKKWILIPETGKYKCSICPEECNSAFEVFIHFKCVHLDAHYKCPDAKCGKLFPSLKSYRHHAYLETRYECPFCKEMVKKGMLYWHKKKNGDDGSCPARIGPKLDHHQQVSENENNQDDNTNDHVSTENKEEIVSEVSLAVPSISQKKLEKRGPAVQKRNQRAKIKMERNRNQSSTEGTSKPNQNKKYPTPIIIYGSKSNAKKSFKKFIRKSGKYKYKCSLCPKEYTGSTHTINHFNSIHLKIRYKCPVAKCGKVFSYQRNYDLHAEFYHVGIRHECPYCKAKLTRGMLYWHKKKNEEGGNCSLKRRYNTSRR